MANIIQTHQDTPVERMIIIKMKPKISHLEKMLEKGWVIKKRMSGIYIILVKNDDEIFYNVPEERIVSMYKR
ncbi:hypothetical protein LCGC14_0556690 [marine sediment metagenome]|uniref:Uncharacterized protein n=1 Tax=marine sediment metagenome TaxID=412755 RepID=A0A0F9U9P5_9ZZZZ